MWQGDAAMDGLTVALMGHRSRSKNHERNRIQNSRVCCPKLSNA